MNAVEVNQCSIDTLAVTIKALHVSRKQMTLAVFRQLPECGDLLDADVLWGFTRYNFDGWDLWLVVQRGERLYRKRAANEWFEDRPLIDDVVAAENEAKRTSEAFETAWTEHEEFQALAFKEFHTSWRIERAVETTSHHAQLAKADAERIALRYNMNPRVAALPQLFIAL